MCNRHISPIKTAVYWAGVGYVHLPIWRNWSINLPLWDWRCWGCWSLYQHTTWNSLHKDPWRGSFLVVVSEICESYDNWFVLIQPVDQIPSEYHSLRWLLGNLRPHCWLTLGLGGIHFMNWPHFWIQFISCPCSPFALLFFPPTYF